MIYLGCPIHGAEKGKRLCRFKEDGSGVSGICFLSPLPLWSSSTEAVGSVRNKKSRGQALIPTP